MGRVKKSGAWFFVGLLKEREIKTHQYNHISTPKEMEFFPGKNGEYK